MSKVKSKVQEELITVYDEDNIYTNEYVSKLFDDLTYSGLDLDKLRIQLFTDDHENPVEVPEAINRTILSLTSLAKCGNNLNKLTKKIKDVNTGNMVVQRLGSVGFINKANTCDDLTLPRIGIAFCGTYLLLRKLKASKLSAVVSTSLAKQYQDMAFVGWPEVRNKPGYDDYYKNFSDLIDQDVISQKEQSKMKPDEKKAYEEKMTEKREKWMKIAQDGYAKDRQKIRDLNNKYLRSSAEYDDVVESIIEMYSIYMTIDDNPKYIAMAKIDKSLKPSDGFAVTLTEAASVTTRSAKRQKVQVIPYERVIRLRFQFLSDKKREEYRKEGIIFGDEMSEEDVKNALMEDLDVLQRKVPSMEITDIV